MAQKSITSFFSIVPKKESEVILETTIPRQPKRQRINSSNDENGTLSDSKETSPVKIEKKTKAKRRRISSESETDLPKSPEKPVKQEKTSPINEKSRTTKSKDKLTIEKSEVKDKKKDLTPNKQIKVKFEKSPISTSLKNNVQAKNGNDENKTDKAVLQEHVAASEYNPLKPKYHPIEDACWSKGEAVPYLALAKTLEAIEDTSSRLKMIDILANYFRSVIALTPEDLLPSVYMCLNQIAPAYHSLELGIAETYLMKAIGQCTGRTLAQMKSAAAKSGDLGLVAEQARSTQRTMFTPPPLLVRKLFVALKEIANLTGQASVNKKIGKIQSLYVACRNSEARYLIRCLEGKLRIGLAEQSVLQALALAVATTPPASDGVVTLDASKGLSPEQFKARVDEHALIIKTTYCECPNYDMIMPVLLQHGCHKLPEHCRLTPGIPLKPMLAHPTKDIHTVFNRFESEQFTCEWKYDGERAQIHVPSADAGDQPDLSHAAIFSRNQENNTSKYPDILRRLPALLKSNVSSCVLDCEAVAYDVVNKQILPFQILSTRKRKDASESDIKVQVCVFVFDLLYLNGKPLVREPLAQRRALLKEHFNEVEGEWQFATSKDCTTMEEVQQFLDESVKGSCEGLMVKTLTGDHAKYDIARRSHNWLKLKKDYLEGVGDTIDVVVIGGYRGRGKRTGVFGGFLLACYDPDCEEFQSLCKIGTGFSDEDLQTLSQTLQEHVIEAPRNYYRFDSTHSPDVWFAPACVWEVRCADLSLSPAHRAAIGLVDPDKGISLRFPRFIRVRDDKAPELATSARQVADLYMQQDQVKNSATKTTHQDEFY